MEEGVLFMLYDKSIFLQVYERVDDCRVLLVSSHT